ncbi:CoA transferase [Tsukamurella sp. 8F]|uniref:CoA transferase n=1 Tax=unclassified Tsukamurella TaxID=2633480 RepID=UPI0023BA2DB8|nr:MULTISPECIES: CoA transferase [unclassified Tsukamurella]MDF0528718.1 CoA transferase [Tsukamurella sp. 8J]MDF0585680.1 CoA transferase [Tsukamurella sp. 8F]
MTANARGSGTVDDVLQGLYRDLGFDPAAHVGEVDIAGQDPVVPSVHRIGDAAAAALAALGSEVSSLWVDRGGEAQDISVSVEAAICQLMAIWSTRVNGVTADLLMEDPNLLGNSDFYRAGDGRYIFVLLSYPALRDIACGVLDCPPDRRRMSEVIARWNAFDLEEAVCSRGGTAIAVRTQEEWRAHPQGRILADGPLIDITRVADSPPEPLLPLDPVADALPLTGARVLDNTHVIAGPIAARILAELDAEVLHVSTPVHPDPIGMIVETGIGKRSAFCDLTDSEDARRFRHLVGGADVYVCNYLDLDAKGYGPLALVEERPGLVVLDYHGWGLSGPWSRRGGFDQLACAASGFSAEEGSFDGPRLPPTHLLNDYMASILGAAGVIEALRRRARDGGSYHVHVDLAKVCMWIQDLGLFDRARVAELPAPDPAAVGLEPASVTGPFGATTYLPTQIGYSTLRPRLRRSAEPLGASPLEWR